MIAAITKAPARISRQVWLKSLNGDTTAARKSYQDFFTLWKDADPDITTCKPAKTEYAKSH